VLLTLCPVSIRDTSRAQTEVRRVLNSSDEIVPQQKTLAAGEDHEFARGIPRPFADESQDIQEVKSLREIWIAQEAAVLAGSSALVGAQNR
jgi:hypothetical protein